MAASNGGRFSPVIAERVATVVAALGAFPDCCIGALQRRSASMLLAGPAQRPGTGLRKTIDIVEYEVRPELGGITCAVVGAARRQ